MLLCDWVKISGWKYLWSSENLTRSKLIVHYSSVVKKLLAGLFFDLSFFFVLVIWSLFVVLITSSPFCWKKTDVLSVKSRNST